MQAENNESSPKQFTGWEQAERDQILHIARNTTPLQRVQWLDEMLELFRDKLPRRDGTDPRFRPEE